MNLELRRIQMSENSTTGVLLIEDVRQCYTLEDKVREIPELPVERWKVPGKTAIPKGKYAVILTMSARFGRVLPLLVDVPGFAGIRIHPGNTAADTEGCILVGRTRGEGFVGESRQAFAELFEKLSAAFDAGEKIIIEIF